MKDAFNFGEEIREFLHPRYPQIKVSVAMPDQLAQSKIAAGFTKAGEEGDTAKAVAASEDALAQMLRGVSGIAPKSGHEPTMKEWAHELFAARYEFRRDDPVIAVIDDKQLLTDGTPNPDFRVVRDPVSGLPLKEGEYRTWQDPRTARMHVVLWDAEKNEPVRKINRVAYGNHIIESVLFNATDDEPGKDSPTLSADQ